MSEAEEIDALAERVLNLWQDQVSALAADPETARLLEGALKLWLGSGAGALAWQSWPLVFNALAGAPGRGGQKKEHDGARQTASALDEAGAAPTAAAPRDGGGDLARLQARLAALEERIAHLEGTARRRSGGARRAARKGRT